MERPLSLGMSLILRGVGNAMELRKALEVRLDDLVREHGAVDGLDRFDEEVRKLVAEILIERAEMYIWEDVQDME